jgi:hypothetical protein
VKEEEEGIVTEIAIMVAVIVPVDMAEEEEIEEQTDLMVTEVVIETEIDLIEAADEIEKENEVTPETRKLTNERKPARRLAILSARELAKDVTVPEIVRQKEKKKKDEEAHFPFLNLPLQKNSFCCNNTLIHYFVALLHPFSFFVPSVHKKAPIFLLCHYSSVIKKQTGRQIHRIKEGKGKKIH